MAGRNRGHRHGVTRRSTMTASRPGSPIVLPCGPFRDLIDAGRPMQDQVGGRSSFSALYAAGATGRLQIVGCRILNAVLPPFDLNNILVWLYSYRWVQFPHWGMRSIETSFVFCRPALAASRTVSRSVRPSMSGKCLGHADHDVGIQDISLNHFAIRSERPSTTAKQRNHGSSA